MRRDESSRIVGYDVARALAVIGMVLVNYRVVMVQGDTDPAWLHTFVGALEGRAVAVFVVLAGVGLSLLSRRSRASGDAQAIARDRNVILKRALFLFVVGLLYVPLWPADILHFYGLYLALGAFLIGASSWRLWLSAAALMAGSVAMFLVFDYDAGWDWDTLSYSGLWTASGMLRHLFFNGFHPVFPWAAFLVLGLWLGRMELTDPKIRRPLLMAAAVVAAVTEILSALAVRAASMVLTAREAEEISHLLATHPIPPTPQYIVAGGATAVVVILLSIECTHSAGDARWLRPLVAAGQLALTLYVAHVVLGMGLLAAFGRLENQDLEFAAGAAVIFSVAAMIFAVLWRHRFRRGPLEWVMRRLTG